MSSSRLPCPEDLYGRICPPYGLFLPDEQGMFYEEEGIIWRLIVWSGNNWTWAAYELPSTFPYATSFDGISEYDEFSGNYPQWNNPRAAYEDMVYRLHLETDEAE